MPSCLNGILNSTEPAGTISPYALQRSDVDGMQLVPICLFGIFNPMGPTLVALNLVLKDTAPSSAVLATTLNPFSQQRLIVARASTDPEQLPQLLPTLWHAGNDPLLAGRPDFFLLVLTLDGMADASRSLLRELLTSVPAADPLSKTIQDFRRHWQDPWSRIPSMEEMFAASSDKARSEPVAATPDDGELSEWFSIVTDTEHIKHELPAIHEGWKGAIGMTGGLSHMPPEKMGAELAALGLPIFPRG